MLGAGEPVLQEAAYAVEHIEAHGLIVIPPETAVLKVNKLIVANRSHLAEEVDLRGRAAMLQEAWEALPGIS